jgi:hypothetical protein
LKILLEDIKRSHNIGIELVVAVSEQPSFNAGLLSPLAAYRAGGTGIALRDLDYPDTL